MRSLKASHTRSQESFAAMVQHKDKSSDPSALPSSLLTHKETNDSPTCLSLFCGMGGGALGFKDAGFNLIGGIDSWEEAIDDYELLTGSKGHVADLSMITPEELRAMIGERRPDVVFTSPPCLPAGEEIITPDGAVPIETLRAGALVLTHKGRYRPVRHVGTHTYEGTMYGLRLNGSPHPIRFTAEHPIYIRRLVSSTGGKKKLKEPAFLRADEVRVGDRVGFPIIGERRGCAATFINSFGDPQIVTRGGHDRPTSCGRASHREHTAHDPRIKDLRPMANEYALWYCIGVYLGDGYRRKDRTSVIYCVGPEGGELDVKVRENLELLGLSYSVTRGGGPTNIKIRVSSKHLWLITEAFGDGAENKAIPEPLLALERDLIEALWQGYLDSDGSIVASSCGYKGRERVPTAQIASTSLKLLEGVQRLLLALGKWSGIHKCWDGGPQVIEGRDVMTRPRWTLRMRLTPTRKRRVAEFADGMIWTRVRAIEALEVKEEVWNLDVEEDDTFCAHMIATHNCKAFSNCLPRERAKEKKYQHLNSLTEYGIFVLLEAWETPPAIILFENVPQIQSRGREYLDAIVGMLQGYGYAVTESTHDCGELGGLGQSRRRFLLIARHIAQVPEFVYEPPKQQLVGCGEVISALPVPLPYESMSETLPGGPLHRLPRLCNLNWLRLAAVRAGKDWRDLPAHITCKPWPEETQGEEEEGGATEAHKVSPELGCEPRRTVYGVHAQTSHTGAVIGHARCDNGAWGVADPRVNTVRREGAVGVIGFEDTSTTVIGQGSHHNGPWQVADPRVSRRAGRHSGGFGVETGALPAHTVTGHHEVHSTRAAIQESRAVTCTHKLMIEEDGEYVLYGPVVDFDDKSPTFLLIEAPDGTWHRPMTTAELGLLQSFPSHILTPLRRDEQTGLFIREYVPLDLSGGSQREHRMRIGNAVPPKTAKAIGETILRSLDASNQGSFLMSGEPIWVAPRVCQAPENGAELVLTCHV